MAIFFSLYHLAYAETRFVTAGEHTIISIGLGLAVFLLSYLLKIDRRELLGKIDFVLTLGMIIAAIGLTAFFFTRYIDLTNRLLAYTQLEYLFALILALIITDGTRRAYGLPFTLIVLATTMYAYFGPYLGPVAHSGAGWKRILEAFVLTTSGIYGFIPKVGAIWIVLFLVFAGLFEGYGALELFLALGKKLSGFISSGVTQVAIIASLLMGSISGSAAANTATTGAFTIPLIKDQGISGRVAAAIESSASSGGQVMPPVMGASAFVMASILDIPYAEVIRIALIPAILFYASIAISVYVLTSRMDLNMGEGVGETTDMRLIDGVPFAFAVGVLIYYLGIIRYGPMTSALNTIIILVIAQFVWQAIISEDQVDAVVTTAKKTVKGLQIGATTSAPIMVVLGAIAMIVEMIQVGNIVQTITFLMLDVSGGNLLLLLFLAMVLSLVFGMGMPTVAAYVVVAVFVGPAVTQFGMPQVYAHIFVFYFAILSAITPPIALAVVVASGIAESDFLSSCYEALKISLPAFLIPYAFLIHTELLAWSALTPVYSIVVLIGLVGVILSIHGYLRQSIPTIGRVILALSAIAIIFSGSAYVNTLGVVVTLASLAYMRSSISNRYLERALGQN